LSPALVSFVPLPGEELGRRVGAGRVAVGPAGRRGLLFCRPGAGARTLCRTRLEHGDVDHASGERTGCDTAVSELRSSLGAAGCSTGKPSFGEAGLPHQKAATARAPKRQQRGFCSSLKIPCRENKPRSEVGGNYTRCGARNQDAHPSNLPSRKGR
jgi:hypothetical protein